MVNLDAKVKALMSISTRVMVVSSQRRGIIQAQVVCELLMDGILVEGYRGMFCGLK